MPNPLHHVPCEILQQPCMNSELAASVDKGRRVFVPAFIGGPPWCYVTQSDCAFAQAKVRLAAHAHVFDSVLYFSTHVCLSQDTNV
eukprot:1160919-Pelagomonas_calceolata.AAC.12